VYFIQPRFSHAPSRPGGAGAPISRLLGHANIFAANHIGSNVVFLGMENSEATEIDLRMTYLLRISSP
jgi:hypothetical protein